ncbi:unnamed protein product [Rotaria magnacalcarata]
MIKFSMQCSGFTPFTINNQGYISYIKYLQTCFIQEHLSYINNITKCHYVKNNGVLNNAYRYTQQVVRTFKIQFLWVQRKTSNRLDL